MKSMKSVESHLFKDIMQTKKDVLFREMFVAVLFSFLTICVSIPRPFTIPQVLRPEGQETEEEDEEDEEEAEKERTKVTFSWGCFKIYHISSLLHPRVMWSRVPISERESWSSSRD